MALVHDNNLSALTEAEIEFATRGFRGFARQAIEATQNAAAFYREYGVLMDRTCADYVALMTKFAPAVDNYRLTMRRLGLTFQEETDDR